MILIVEILLSVAIAGLIHELGHYLTALTFGHHLVFRRQGFRLIWDMPEDTPKHQRLILYRLRNGDFNRAVALFCGAVAVSVG